ncbi:MAG: proline dehydrogenase family protein [Chitinophagales bacterium]|nr:proline dehydrogenase family protein [Chitinophagales bacterium]
MSISPQVFENTKVAFAAKTDGDLQQAKVLFTLMANNRLVELGSSLAISALQFHLPVAPLFRWTVYNHFCGGETFEECKKVIRQLEESNTGVLLNYGVELKETDEDFDKALAQNKEAVEFASGNKAVKAVCVKPTSYGRLALFEKIQQGTKLTKAEQKEFERVKERFDELCSYAASKNTALYIDAEESWIQDTLDAMVEELMSRYNRESCVVFNTFQLYRWDRLAYLQKQIDKAKTDGYLLGAKLVRGAYMEKERERATEKNYKSPIHANKQGVDEDFDKAVALCLENINAVYVCIASQSEQSNLNAMQMMEEKNMEPGNKRVVFSQLYGMGDNITFNQAKLGFNATKYLPYGPVKEVIPYLIRRAQENTSVAGQTGRELSLIKKELKRRKGC